MQKVAKTLTPFLFYDNNIINGGEKWKDYLRKNYLIGKKKE